MNLHLNAKQASIEFIHFETFNWELAESDDHHKTWVNLNRSALIGVHFFDIPPDISAKFDDIDFIRHSYRTKLIKESNGGLIWCDLLQVREIHALEIIIKQPLQPKGLTYVGSITIPFSASSFVLKTQAIEDGMTGVREAFIFPDWAKQFGVPTSNEDPLWQQWASDPYDKSIKEGILMNYAEKMEFDDDFPTHPLTVVRKNLEAIKASVIFGEELLRLEKF